MNYKLDLKDVNLKNERDIVKNWDLSKNPFVSICCIAYNQEEYIEDTLKGFLMQETKFSYEILIHDDASTDTTQEIIKRYEKLYPNIIKPIYQKENQHSKNIRIMPTFNFTRINGEFVAICEGDDFWIDKQKLQKQIDFLLKNEDYNFCFHKAYLIKMKNNNEVKTLGAYSEENSKIDFETILSRSEGMIPTASCVIKSKVIKNIIDFISSNTYLKQSDTIIQYLSSYDKGALYLNDVMSVYRFQTKTSWTEKYAESKSFKAEVYISKIKTQRALDLLFENRYSSILNDLNLDILIRLLNHLKINDRKSGFEELNYFIKNLFINIFKSKDLQSNGILLYGASTMTQWFIESFPNIKIKHILDSDINKHDTYFLGIRLVHPSKIKDNKDLILITLWDRQLLISRMLIKDYNVNKNQIIKLDYDNLKLKQILENISKLETY